MLHIRIAVPAALTEPVLDVFSDDQAVSHLAVLRGASIQPSGDLVMADVAREAANEIIERLESMGVAESGTIHVGAVESWVSKSGLEAERQTPGRSADAVVWADVTQSAYDESELNWTYVAFMTMATMLAGIAIVLDSQILVIGAMVLGPEFITIAALGLALVRGRGLLFGRAIRTLAVGFIVAIVLTTLAALVARGLGWIVVEDVTGARPGTDFIYSTDKWSFIVALIAAAAGVLSLTSAKVGGLSGAFISVTTIPAAGNVALGAAFGAMSEVWGSALQLLVNITGMVVAGWLTLALQQMVWNKRARTRLASRQKSQQPGT
ncbi:DUF389 domain-containing protein [Aeromicrobium sp.]|uniref:DUF389 domain-containing protein n=1 Tax=Aeromicrobium sp. TaxID=1871063 RepID=UPI0019BDF734|nr:DUF389 domain-containing protein [Aeromicrobium sp.]MBC7630584.1 DUF389 domain-containing protein [Aeromicrobium sp.]